MKRRKRRRIKWGRIFICLLLFIGICYFIFKNINNVFDKKNNSNDKVIEKVEDEEEKSYSLSLVMVGDNLIHDKIYNYFRNGNSYDFKPMLEYIKPIVSKYDLAYYNQETILGGSDIGVSSYPAFNSPYEVGDAMIDSGFNLVSLATNHTMDRGEKAILNSRNYWNNKKDVLAVGSYSSYDERDKIDIREVNSIKYTLLNYTYGTNGINVPSDKSYLVNIWPVSGSNPNNDSKYQDYKEQIKKDIDRVRDKVDLLLVAMHWGIEYEYVPNTYQEDMAKYLESLGVDIIIGTHPHVIQPIDWINDTLVIYSLGNFVSSHEVVNIGNRIGLLSSVKVVKDSNGIKIDNDMNELLYMYYTSNYKDFKVIPFSMLKTELSNKNEVYDKFSNIVKSKNSNIVIKGI